jgi:hypothetical protein
MKHYAVNTYSFIIICALILSACSGSGSAPGEDVDGAQGNGGTGGPVSIAITSPASGANMETPDKSVVLEGTAKSNNAIASVFWRNNRGGQGAASGTALWKTGAIPLELGKNSITITARDSTGATAKRTVVIKRDSSATGSVTLAWEAPTTREDGSALTNLAGYRIKYGRMSKTYDYEIDIDNPGILTYVVENLRPGNWHFVASAYDSTGLESNFSNEVVRVIP